MYFSLVCGALFLIVWAAVRGPMRGIYMKRFQVSDLRVRPPPLGLAGLWRRCFGYIAPVLFITDLELMHTAGLDALVLCRFVEMGVQLFIPLTVLCCAVCECRRRPAPHVAVTGGGHAAAQRASPACLPHAHGPPLPCLAAAVLPLCLSGSAVEDNPSEANVASLMKWTLSNIEERSHKLWCVARLRRWQGAVAGPHATPAARPSALNLLSSTPSLP